MNKFKVGDRVVALTDPRSNKSQPRRKGETYNVLAIQYCIKCGRQAINVSGTYRRAMTVCSCGAEQFNEGLWWTHSKHFTYPQDLTSEIESAFNQSMLKSQ